MSKKLLQLLWASNYLTLNFLFTIILQFLELASELFKIDIYEIQIAILSLLKCLSKKFMPEHNQEVSCNIVLVCIKLEWLVCLFLIQMLNSLSDKRYLQTFENIWLFLQIQFKPFTCTCEYMKYKSFSLHFG